MLMTKTIHHKKVHPNFKAWLKTFKENVWKKIYLTMDKTCRHICAKRGWATLEKD